MIVNGSFENGHYDIGNSQIPNGWGLMWYLYPHTINEIDGAEHSQFKVGEGRVLHKTQIPPAGNPHHIEIPHGENLVKLFSGYKSIYTRFWQLAEITKEGVYELTVTILPDLVESYNPDGSKVYAPDPMSGRIKLFCGEGGQDWIHATFGQWQEISKVFFVATPGHYNVGLEMMSPHPIEGNNWFIDNIKLVKVEEGPEPLIIEIPEGREVDRIEVYLK